MIPTKEQAQAIFEAHITTLFDMHNGQITDIEAFNDWATKVATAMTSTTLAFMYPIEAELEIEDTDAKDEPTN